MNNKEQASIVISQEQLVDYLFHAATREDIAKLDSKIDNKLDILESRIDSKFDATIAEFKRSNEAFEARIDRQFQKIAVELENTKASNDRQFQKIAVELENAKASNDRQFQKIDHRYNWIIGVTLGTGVAVSGLIIALVNFVIKLH